jgi:hypothetical protein
MKNGSSYIGSRHPSAKYESRMTMEKRDFGCKPARDLTSHRVAQETRHYIRAQNLVHRNSRFPNIELLLYNWRLDSSLFGSLASFTRSAVDTPPPLPHRHPPPPGPATTAAADPRSRVIRLAFARTSTISLDNKRYVGAQRRGGKPSPGPRRAL